VSVSPAEAAALLEVFLQDVRIAHSDPQPPPPPGPITRPMRPEKSEERMLSAGDGDADALSRTDGRGEVANRPVGKARPAYAAAAARGNSQPSPPTPPSGGTNRPVPKVLGRGGSR
jgi:hypothetical protein